MSLVPEEITKKLKGTDHRVLYQNAEGNINMGVFFNDPDVDLDDFYWYNVLAHRMALSIGANEGLIVFDEESDTYSCYVELHRNGYGFKLTLIRIKYDCYWNYSLRINFE